MRPRSVRPRARHLLCLFAALLSLTILASACAGPAPTPQPAASAAPSAVEGEQGSPTSAATVAPASQPTEPAPTATATAAPTPTAADETVHLSVFEAGSLMIPLAAIEEAFEAENPDVDVELEAHGSIQVIRHVTDLHVPIDVVASADYALLSMLMYQTDDPDTGLPYASWNVRFASNRMAIAYSADSPGADEINADNWYEVIARPGTRLGLSDPRFDACGYRQLMVLQLAEEVYDQPRVFESALTGRFMTPITTAQEDERTVIHVPELLEPRPKSTIVLRGSSVQLIPLLQSGDVDYIFEYESVARQHDLQYITLPPEVNLGDADYADLYGTVQVKLDFQRFASVDPVFDGGVISYGLTIPSNAPHPEAAQRFVSFLLGPEGQAIMQANHHPLLDPLLVDRPEQMPEGLCPQCETEGG